MTKRFLSSRVTGYFFFFQKKKTKTLDLIACRYSLDVVAEAEGLALTSSDGTVDMEVFINGPDGSGPWNCQSSSDLTLKVLEPMSIKLQLPGVKGIDNSLKTTYRPLRAVFSK